VAAENVEAAMFIQVTKIVMQVIRCQAAKARSPRSKGPTNESRMGSESAVSTSAGYEAAQPSTALTNTVRGCVKANMSASVRQPKPKPVTVQVSLKYVHASQRQVIKSYPKYLFDLAVTLAFDLLNLKSTQFISVLNCN